MTLLKGQLEKRREPRLKCLGENIEVIPVGKMPGGHSQTGERVLAQLLLQQRKVARHGRRIRFADTQEEMGFERRVLPMPPGRKTEDAAVVPPDGWRARQMVSEKGRFLQQRVEDEERSKGVTRDASNVIAQRIPSSKFRPKRVPQKIEKRASSAAGWFIGVGGRSIITSTPIAWFRVARAVADANEQERRKERALGGGKVSLFCERELVIAVHEQHRGP